MDMAREFGRRPLKRNLFIETLSAEIDKFAAKTVQI